MGCRACYCLPVEFPFEEQVEGTRAGVALLADQNIIPAVLSQFGYQQARRFAQPPFGMVAGDGIADFFGAGVADANAFGWLTVPAFAAL